MKSITVSNFGNGMSNDLYSGGLGEFSISKNFDILTYPNRLFPLPSMKAATTGTGITNMVVAGDGNVYGLGYESASGTSNSDIWKATPGSSTWTELPNCAGTGLPTANQQLLVYYKENHATQDLLYSIPAGIRSVESGNVTTGQTFSLTYTTMTQGVIHPLNNTLFMAYTNTTNSYVASKLTTASWSFTALTLPAHYTPTSVSPYGNYLAIACTIYSSGAAVQGGINNSVLILWDMVSTTWQEIVLWGDDALLAINNLNGVLIGVSTLQSTLKSGIFIKGYSGGQPEILKKIQINSASTVVAINQKVNFIHNNRFYFSADLPGSGNEPILKGLWSLGKGENGRWALNLERIPTADGTNASLISAVLATDYFHAIHTTNTATVQFLGTTPSTDFINSSIHESIVNPEMPENDKVINKQLSSFSIKLLPLTSSGQVIVKYRVDSDRGAWTTIFTKTSTSPNTNLVFYSSPKPSSGQFRAGFNYEFRIESTGGAQITGYSYEYKPLTT